MTSHERVGLELLAGLAHGERVARTALERDPYSWPISRCRAGDIVLSEAGLAWAFTRYCYDYAKAEVGAARRGI